MKKIIFIVIIILTNIFLLTGCSNSSTPVASNENMPVNGEEILKNNEFSVDEIPCINQANNLYACLLANSSKGVEISMSFEERKELMDLLIKDIMNDDLCQDIIKQFKEIGEPIGCTGRFIVDGVEVDYMP